MIAGFEVEVPGATLYVERAGSGAPLLSISGSGSALSDGLRPATLPLSQHFDTIGYDHRGLGLSRSEVEVPTMTDFAADALALADAVGWDRFAVIGLSFGGMVAQHLAVLAGDRITSLVLGCTSSGGAGGSSYPLHELPDAETMLTLVDSRPEVQAMLRAAAPPRPDPTTGLLRQLEARRHHDIYGRLPEITAPTLVASGRYDVLAPPQNGEAIARQIPRSRFQLFEGGHIFPLQDATAWPAFITFLQDPDV